MANQYQYQVLKDSNQKATIRLTANFDGTGDESNAARIQANTLAFALDNTGANLMSSPANSGVFMPYYGLGVEKIFWSGSAPSPSATIRLFWFANTVSSTNTKTIANLGVGYGAYNDNGNWPTMSNPTAGDPKSNGDIGVVTSGYNAANSSYTIILELRKDNNHYDRGSLRDPAAFNRGDYSIKP